MNEHKSYRLRWRVLILAAVMVVLSCGYVAWRFVQCVCGRWAMDGRAADCL